MKKLTILLLMLYAFMGYSQTSSYCETVTYHFDNSAEVTSAIKLTITNVDATSMYVEIESNDADPVDLLIVELVTDAPTITDGTTTAGKIRKDLTWGTAPTNVSMQILWSKVSTGGNWMLTSFTVPFAANCDPIDPAADATLSDLKVGGTTIDGFASGTLEYNYKLADISSIPALTATATNTSLPASKVVVTNTTTVPGQSTVVVTSEDNSDTKTYKVNFSEAYTVNLDFEDEPSNAPVGFGGGVLTWELNTEKSGINTSDSVLKMVKGTPEVYAGGEMILGDKIDFSEKKYFSMKVFSPRVGVPVLLKFEGTGSNEKTATTTVANQWETLEFDFTGSTSDAYNKMVLIFENGTLGDGSANWTFLVDDILQFKPVDATLSDLTVGGTTVTGFDAATTEYTVILPNGDPLPTVAGVANDAANAVVTPTQATGQAPATATVQVVNGSRTVTYSVLFVYTSPTTDAPTPTKDAVDVVSIFSDAYENINVTNFGPVWGAQSARVNMIVDGQDSVMQINTFDYQGADFATTNVSSMEYLHVDIWTNDASTIQFTPIGSGETLVSLTPSALGEWKSYDIAVTDFTGVNLSAINQYKFAGGDGSQTVYVDNLYFWKAPTIAATDATLSDLKVGSETVDGFNSGTVLYTVDLVDGATVPTVSATATNNGNADVSITQASTTLPDTAVVVVTAQDGITKKTYKVAFAYNIPATAAPTPTKAAADVISIFSDAFTNVNVTNFGPVWGAQKSRVAISVDGQDSVLQIKTFDFQGAEFASTDVSSMEYVHVDIWTNDASTVTFTPIGSGETPVSLSPIVLGQWKGYDIPVADFTAVNLSAISQYKFDGGDGSKTIHVDNIYFWKAPIVADSKLRDLTVGGTTVSGFVSTTTDYNVILADGAAIPTIDATAVNDGNANVTITQATGALPADATIVVKSEDLSSTTTYTVTFDLAPSAVYCDDIVTHFNLPAETASSIYLTIENIDETSMFIQIESADADPVDLLIVNGGSGATISDADESVAGKIKRTLTWTTAPDSAAIELLWSKVSNGGNWMLNTFKVHTQAVCRASTDATLSAITLSEGTLSPAFDAATLTYSVVLPFGSSVPTVTATKNHHKADTTVTAATAIPGATKILVTAEDGSTKTYTINFSEGAASTEATLSAITLSEGTLSPAFDAATETYSVLLPFGSSVPTVTATTTDSNADTTVTAATALPGSTTILVTAQDATTTKTYTINFSVDASSVSTLSDLKVNDVAMPGFKADSVAYEYEVPFGTVVFPTLTYTVTDATATATIIAATLATKTDTVKVTAQDGSITKYMVKYVYAAASTDATLKDIALNGTTISGFKADSMDYPVELPFGTTEVPVVTAACTHESATNVITKATALSDTAIIVATAQDGLTTKTYKVSFTVATEISTDATLQSIKVSDVALPDFAADKYFYIAEIPFGTTTVPQVVGTKNNLAATVVMDTAKTLADTAVITVTAQDGVTVKTYKVAFIVSEPVYDVKFIVSDGSKGFLKGAQIAFMLDTLITDINGAATFTQVSVTTDAAYSVTLDGYEDVAGTLSVVDANITKEIVMTLKTYDVKFNVSDETGAAIAKAEVVFLSDTILTDSTGFANFSKVAPVTDAAFSISKAGYFANEGTLSVVDSAIVQNIVLQLEAYQVKFLVNDADTLPIKDASIVLGTDTITTDSTGLALFNKVVPGKTAYSISKEGYASISDSISVIDTAVNVGVFMQKQAALFAVSFTIVDADTNSIEGAVIAISEQTLTTNAEGKAEIELAAGETAYTITKEGFIEATGTVTVVDTAVAVNITLDAKTGTTYAVTFTVVDAESNALADAQVVLLGDTVLTDTEGKAVFTELDPVTDAEYTVSKDTYETITGNVTIVDADVEVDVQLLTVGIKQSISMIGKIYPNPSHGEINIALSKEFNNAELLIFTTNGQIVEQKQLHQMETKIDLITKESGIYLVRLVVDNQLFYGKIVINE